MRRKYIARKQRALLGFSLLFIVLGLGNLAVGYSRASEYEALLKDAVMNLSPEPSLLEGAGLPAPPESEANKEVHIRRLTARLDFYRTVMAGGKVFLGIAGFMLLFVLLLSRDNEPEPVSS